MTETDVIHDTGILFSRIHERERTVASAERTHMFAAAHSLVCEKDALDNSEVGFFAVFKLDTAALDSHIVEIVFFEGQTFFQRLALYIENTDEYTLGCVFFLKR